MAAVSGSAPDCPRLQRGADLSQLHSHGSPAWTCTTTTRLTAGYAALTSLGMVPPRGIAPRSSTYRADALLLSYGGWLENWSRAPVLPRVSPRPKRGGFADSLARDVEIGGLCGPAMRDPADAGLFVAELTGRMKLVDRHGFAPCSSACKADDLLTDRAAHWKTGCGGRIRTGGARRMKPLPCHLATPRFGNGLAGTDLRAVRLRER